VFSISFRGVQYIVQVVTTRQRGRPRDPAIDDALLTATRELLVETGYVAMTMEAVAARAGVSKPTLYLRYPTKGELVFEAVFGKTKALELPDTGNLVADLSEAYAWAVEEFAAPEARAAIPGVLTEFSSSPELAEVVRQRVIDPEYARVRGLLERAQSRGEIDADADLTLALDAFVGTALARATVVDRPLDHDFAKRLVDLLVAGLAPRR
jgi:AcrR family transcriptional regulator